MIEKLTQNRKKVRDMIPDVTITSDFIAGFPGETEEQFKDTLTAIDEFELDYCNVAAYSPREKQLPQDGLTNLFRKMLK